MEFRVVNATAGRLPAVPWAALFRRVQRHERAQASTSVALILVPPRRLAALNRQYRGIAGPTDVLAFPVSARLAGRDGSGDILLCPTVLRRRFPGQPLRPLLAHRFVHALLHLHGHRHDTAAAARRMETRTQRCLTPRYGQHHPPQHSE